MDSTRFGRVAVSNLNLDWRSFITLLLCIIHKDMSITVDDAYDILDFFPNILSDIKRYHEDMLRDSLRTHVQVRFPGIHDHILNLVMFHISTLNEKYLLDRQGGCEFSDHGNTMFFNPNQMLEIKGMKLRGESTVPSNDMLLASEKWLINYFRNPLISNGDMINISKINDPLRLI